ncbi:MAG: glycosyltransferase [Bacteroidetes bacterium]|nr:glycosyltransferase [Bacteroidota bacterium]
MKIGIISSMAASPWGGSEELWVAIARSALEAGHGVAVSVYDWGALPFKIAELKDTGVSIHKRSRISYGDVKGKIKGLIIKKIFAIRQLNAFISSEAPDILVLNTGAFCDLEIDAVRTFLLKINIPFFIVVHSNTDTYTLAYHKLDEVRSVCKKAQKVFFVSERLRQQAERQIAYSFDNSEIVKNPVNMDQVGVIPYKERPIVQMACVGYIQVAVKGQAMLLQLLSSDKWKERTWQLNIYGKGPDESLLVELIKFYGLQEKVFLKGYAKNIREEIWSENDVLLMPSYIEGMPISLIEAMLCGRTAVVTDVGGNREVIDDGVNGFIAESPSIYSFDKKMEEAWIKKNDWKQMGEIAFEKANSVFSLKNSFSLLSKMLIKLPANE